MKTRATLALILSLSTGCIDDVLYPERSGWVKKDGNFKGYPAAVFDHKNARRVCIFDSSIHTYDVRHIYGVCAKDANRDGQFDEITIDLPSKSHPLHTFANKSILEDAYQFVETTGKLSR